MWGVRFEGECNIVRSKHEKGRRVERANLIGGEGREREGERGMLCEMEAGREGDSLTTF